MEKAQFAFKCCQTSETVLAWKQTKAWSSSCCSACFGVEAKLVATGFEVSKRRARTALGPPFVIIQFVCPAFDKQEGPFKPTSGPGEDASHSKWGTDGIGQIGDDVVISDGWDFSLSLFPQEGASTLVPPANIEQNRSISQ